MEIKHNCCKECRFQWVKIRVFEKDIRVKEMYESIFPSVPQDKNRPKANPLVDRDIQADWSKPTDYEKKIEECPKCADGIVKAHKIIAQERKLQCLSCGYKQNFELI